MELKLCSVVAPALVIFAGCAAFAIAAGGVPLGLVQSLAWLRDSSMIYAGVLWLSLGLRHVRRAGISLKSASIPVAGLFVLGLLGLKALYAVHLLESVPELIGEPDLERVEARAAAVIADPDSSPERRALASRIRAANVFRRTGEASTVLDESGTESPYLPTEQDHELRRAEQEFLALLPTRTTNARVFGAGVAFVALVSLAVGVYTPVRRMPVATSA